ncbi:MAG TPA: aldo/keto reductase [Chloroflexota bacterium]|jgi:aryl-alcohol dehydrogenase-like predicted oxidoreductase|nr:aldo/keto reductase [Chloroflexota bacterium]
MEYRKMGDSDLVVSAIGFGCWEMGGNYGAIDTRDVTEAIRRALDLGVTLYDTARAYGAGRSEELLGRALGADRQRVVVVTKCGLPTRPDQKPRRDARYASIIEDCEQSLRSLNTDYIDLFLVHWPDVETPIEETMRALNDLRAAGKVRYVGVSNFSAAQLRECRRYAPIIANQVGYNLFDRRWEREMFPTARELGVSIMAYGPLAHGLLTGAFTPETTFEESDWRSRGIVFGQALFTPENFPKNLRVVDQLKTFAADKGTTLPRLALAWVLSNPQVAVALSGTRRPAEIEENVQALRVHLTADDKRQLEEIMTGAAGQVDQIPT